MKYLMKGIAYQHKSKYVTEGFWKWRRRVFKEWDARLESFAVTAANVQLCVEKVKKIDKRMTSIAIGSITEVS